MDFLIAIVCGGCALAGVFWGAVRMTTAAAAVVVAVVATRLAAPAAAALLAGGGTPGTGYRIAAAAGVALLSAGLVLIAGRGVRRGLESVHLGWLDRAVGALLAAGLALAISSLLLALAVTGGWEPRTPWARWLAIFGQTVLAVHSQPTSSARPSSTPPTPTASGQHPR